MTSRKQLAFMISEDDAEIEVSLFLCSDNKYIYSQEWNEYLSDVYPLLYKNSFPIDQAVFDSI